MQKWQCRYAPSLGALEDTPGNIWGTEEYESGERPTVFFGLYGFSDFYALWKHKGEKAILWAGSDIRHFEDGYWLDEKGSITIPPYTLGKWINKYCENWVENEIEQNKLKEYSIFSKVCPSFLGKIDDYKISYKHSDKPKVYSSVSGDDFKLYKWESIETLAKNNPDIEFHLYGNTKEWPTKNKNIIVHGKVPKGQMNREIKTMQGALRLLPFEGFSEIIAKSILWGQWPISEIEYPHMLKVSEIAKLKSMKEPNIKGRKYYNIKLNKYPWNTNI